MKRLCLLISLWCGIILLARAQESDSLNVKQSGFFLTPQLGATLFKEQEFSMTNNTDYTLMADYSLRLALGYQFQPEIAIGVVAGLEEGGSSVLLPLGGYAEGFWGQSKVKAYYQISAGYMLPASSNTDQVSYEAGSFYGARIGMFASNARGNGELLLLFGYQRQYYSKTRHNVYQFPGVGDLTESFQLNRFFVGAGYRIIIAQK